MLYFLFNILVYTVAVIIALVFTPGIQEGTRLGWLELPIVGLVLGF